MKRRFTAAPVVGLLLAALSPQIHAQTADRGIVGITSNGRTVLTNMGGPAPVPVTSSALPASSVYHGLIREISHTWGVDPILTHAVIEIESGFDPTAVSPRGALGLMQLIPSTGRRFGVNNFLDPADNISGGVQFLRFLIEKFQGNVDLVLAAYNSGENRVEQLGRVPAIPETQAYVRKVRDLYERMGGSSVLIHAGTSPTAGTDPPGTIYRSVSRHGTMAFSNIGPVR